MFYSSLNTNLFLYKFGKNRQRRNKTSAEEEETTTANLESKFRKIVSDILTDQQGNSGLISLTEFLQTFITKFLITVITIKICYILSQAIAAEASFG